MFAERIGYLPDDLLDFVSAQEKQARDTGWPDLAAHDRQTLVLAGETALETSWPQILASHYRLYGETGDRADFEALYFARRLKLNALVLAERAEGKGRFLAAAADGIWLICEESGWQLPAHNAYERGGRRLDLPKCEAPVIDLFAAETAANLAMALSLLGEELDHLDGSIRRRIEIEIDRRLVQPYLSRHFWWMGAGAERMNNWTAWITQNVLLATFLLPTSQPTRRRVVEKALGSLDAFTKDYAQDGACEEGVLYYRHAALCLFGAMTVLDRVASGSMTPLWLTPKIRSMAEFIANMHVSGDRYFNFADAPAHVEPCGAREFLFGKAVGSTDLAAFAAADWKRASDRLMAGEWNLWYRLQAIETSSQLDGMMAAPPAKADIFYPGIGLAIARDDRFALAVKGGHNGESHNHNDVGSVTLYKHGRPLLIDVGVETYTALTFSPRRYELWTMQSAYHNLPTFGGVMQCEGSSYGASDMTVAFAAAQAEIAMDFAGAYPPEARVRSYRRRVVLTRGEGVDLFDEHDGDLPAVLSLMTCLEPEITEGAIALGDLATLRVVGAGTPTFERIAITDPRLRQSWPEQIFRILLPLTAARLHLAIK